MPESAPLTVFSDAPRALVQARAAANLTTATARILEFDALSGSTILASEPARDALIAMAADTIPVLTEHDQGNTEPHWPRHCAPISRRTANGNRPQPNSVFTGTPSEAASHA